MQILRVKVSGVLAPLLVVSLLSALALPGGNVRSAASSVFAAPAFVYPLLGPRLSSSFGKRKDPIKRVIRHHSGVDLAAPSGAAVRAVAAGTVVFADPFGGYGRLVVIQHNNGITSHYGHLESIKVKPGEIVKAGRIIGTVGTSGRVTGPHLHFEIRKNGKPQNPERYLPGLSARARG
ncbi:MAG: M23 family metallopeptidase [Candidatus Dadabacteria bacterium]|nr:MAG: M23 family metallopeptidase [Candidatus Dadabacteria bacterium]